MPRFLILDGKHHARDGKVYKKGQIIKHEGDLVAAYGPHRFQRLKKGEEPELEDEDGDDEDAPAIKVPKPEGKDVSDEFKQASENGLTVLRRGKKHHVYAPGSDTPLNEQGLKLGEVKKFVRDYLKSE